MKANGLKISSYESLTLEEGNRLLRLNPKKIS